MALSKCCIYESVYIRTCHFVYARLICNQIPSVLIEESEGLNLNSRDDERSASLGIRLYISLEREALNIVQNILFQIHFDKKTVPKFFNFGTASTFYHILFFITRRIYYCSWFKWFCANSSCPYITEFCSFRIKPVILFWYIIEFSIIFHI